MPPQPTPPTATNPTATGDHPAGDDDDTDNPTTTTVAAASARRRHRRLPIAAGALAVIAAAAITAAVVTNNPPAKTAAKTKPAPTNPTYIPYNDTDAGFALAYPPAWGRVKTTDPAVPLLLNIGADGLDTLLVRVVKLQTSVDTTSVADMKAFTDSVISGTNVTVLQQQSINIQGIAGYYYFYTLPKDPTTGVTLVHSHFFIFPPTHMVSLTFQTTDHDFAQLAPTFDQVVASLHLTG